MAGREFTGLIEVPRKVDGASFEADYELFESLVLCLKKATREGVLSRLQINAALLVIRRCCGLELIAEVSRGSLLVLLLAFYFFWDVQGARFLLRAPHDVDGVYV